MNSGKILEEERMIVIGEPVVTDGTKNTEAITPLRQAMLTLSEQDPKNEEALDAARKALDAAREEAVRAATDNLIEIGIQVTPQLIDLVAALSEEYLRTICDAISKTRLVVDAIAGSQIGDVTLYARNAIASIETAEKEQIMPELTQELRGKV